MSVMLHIHVLPSIYNALLYTHKTNTATLDVMIFVFTIFVSLFLFMSNSNPVGSCLSWNSMWQLYKTGKHSHFLFHSPMPITSHINLISYVIIPVILHVYLLVVFSRYMLMSSISIPFTVNGLAWESLGTYHWFARAARVWEHWLCNCSC